MSYFTQAKKMLLLAFILILLFTANLWAQFPEGFEGGSIPSTWKTYGYFSAQLVGNNAHSGHYVARSVDGYNSNDWLITPQFQITENHRGIRFWARPKSSVINMNFKIHLSTTGRETSDFNVELANYTQTDLSWKEYYIDLSDYISESVYVGIQRIYSGSPSYIIYIDDFDWLYPDDLSAISVNGAKTPIVNEIAEYTVKIKNTGVNTQSDYTVSLFADDAEITRQVGTEIAAGETKDLKFYWTPNIEKRYNLYAIVNMGGDLYQENNQSTDFTVAALSANANESYVGDPNSYSYSNWYPINTYVESSLSQSIYLAEELETAGLIYSIDYYLHSGNDGALIPIKIWMTNTNKEIYDDGDDWLSYEEFSLVFDSEVDFSAIEDNKIRILLDNPFLYEGDNLCVMVQKPWNTLSSYSLQFRTTWLYLGSNRILYKNYDEEINPFNPLEGYGDNYIPNTSFMIDNSLLSSISGIVYSNSIPQAGVKVEIENTRSYAITDAEGKYEIHNLQAGNYNLIASKEGFNDKRLTNLVLTADDTLIQDITIVKLPMLTISGQIIDSLSGLGIGGAQINLTGYQDYETISSETGAFTIPFVYAHKDYLIKVKKTDYDYYEGNISTNMNNLVLPTIELNKIPEHFDHYVGDASTNLFTHFSPINFNSRASISQTIYLAEEINKDYLIGEASINSLRYFANLDGDITNGKPVKIYMTNTEIEGFNTNNAWLSADDFSLVFDGNIDLHKPGNQEIDFILDTPFDYTGHNLAIMMIRHLDETVYSTGNSWKYSESNLYPNRTIFQNSSIEPNITSPGIGTRQNSIPNIAFAFNTVGYASISGIVANEIGPIEGVKVEIEGANRSVMTNAEGEYQLQNLNPGVFNLLASKEGYIDTLIDNIELNINEDIVRDILITDRPLVSVSGKIIASDTGLPLEGTIIKLDNRITETDNTGEYLFDNIYGGKSYLLSISREGYLRHKELIEITFEDQTIPDIALEISPEIYQLLVGDTESNTSYYQYPLNFNSKASLSQTIYTSEELDAYHAVDYDYEICSIKYYANFSSNIPAGKELQIWMANTEISEFANNSSWLPLNEFTQVFAGTLDFSTGIFDLDIELDTPFNYTGDNLVIMVKRNLDTNYYSSNDKFYTNAVTDNRTIYYQTDTRDPDPANPPVGFRTRSIPNTGLGIYTEAFASLSGIVMTDGQPLEGVKIAIDGTKHFAMTNADGEYGFTELLAGTVNLIASKDGYVTVYVDEVDLLAGEEFVHNFDIITAIPLTVSGQVIDANTELPIEGANISLSGANTYTAIANAAGEFSLEEVLSNSKYILTIVKDGLLLYEEMIELERTDYVLPTIRLQPPFIEVLVGDPATTIYTHQFPMNYYFQASLSQTIYLAEELGIAGSNITSITYFALLDGDIPAGKPIKIYMANTDKAVFNDNSDWLPINEFNLVFDGTIDLNMSGEQEISINLDNPFVYAGQNLVIMVLRPLDSVYYISSNKWKYTDVPNQRTIYYQSDSTEPNPANPPSGNRASSVTNTLFKFINKDMTKMNGYVKSAGIGIEGVKISVDNTTFAYTDIDGYYEIWCPINEIYNITASKAGFFDAQIELLITDEETELDIEIYELPTISGHIIASDTNQGIEGAIVQLVGKEKYETETDATGAFIFEKDYIDQDYQLRVFKTGYQVHNQEIVFANEDIELNIILSEQTHTPLNISAQASMHQVDLNWGETEDDMYFTHAQVDRYFNSFSTDQYGESSFTIAQRFSAEHLHRFGIYGANLEKVQFIPHRDNAIYTLKIYTGGSVQGPETLVHSQSFTSIALDQWNEITLSQPIAIPVDDELWIAIEINALFGQPATYDNGLTVDGYGNMLYRNGNWVTLQNYNKEGNWLIRGLASNENGPIVISSTANMDNSIKPLNDLVNTKGDEFGESNLVLASNKVHKIVDTNTRALTHYNIWRAKYTDKDDESNWLEIAAGITETSYTDLNWFDLEYDDYVYIVKAFYTNGLESDPAFSNKVKRDYILVDLSGSIITNHDGEALSGAKVKLEGLVEYDVITSTTGEYFIPDVYASSNYTLTISKEGYHTHTQIIEVGKQDIEIPQIVLDEILSPPANIVAEAGRLSLELSWDAPDIDSSALSFSGAKNLISKTNKQINSRSLTNYSVWRAAEADVENEAAWIELATDLTETNYTDDDWRFVETGYYVYIVKANYITGLSSEPALSNIVERDHIYTNISGNVLASDTNAPVEGAIVRLSGLANYETETLEDGMFILEDIIANQSYTLSIEKDTYKTLIDTISVAFDSFEIEDIILQEITNAPRDIVANYGRLSVELSWTAPDNSQPALLSFARRGSRALLSYDIWRAAEDDIEDEETWVELATNITDTEYIDESWRFTEPGDYVYIVKAVYTNDLKSDPAYSNTIERDIIYNEISGKVYASGTNTPLEAAIIKLNGETNYEVETNEDGEYVFPQVVANRSYDLIVKKDHYTTFIDELVTEFANIVVDDITLQEITNAPIHLIASATRNELNLTWQAPDNNEPEMLSFARRGSRALLSYNIWRAAEEDIGDEEAWEALANSVNQTQYTDEDWASLDDGFYVYIVKAIYSGNVISEPTLSNTVYKGSNFIAVSGLVRESGLDDLLPGATVSLKGIENYETITDENGAYEIEDVHANNQYTFTVSKNGYNIHSEIIAFGSNDEILSDITLIEITNAPLNVLAEASPSQVNLTWAAPDNRTPDLMNTRGTRALMSYKVWRVLEADVENESAWVQIADSVNETECQDQTWASLDVVGNYVYIVKAQYSGNVFSEPALSNAVYRPHGYVEISAFVKASGTNLPVIGALVKLEGMRNYETITTETGKFIIPDVYANQDYILSISKNKYEIYTEEIEVGLEDVELDDITLIEITNAPTNVTATAHSLEAMLAWSAPDNNTPDLLNRSRNTRALLNYDIWRAAENDISNEEAWIEVFRGLVDTTFTDAGWRNAEIGNHIYIIRANYSGSIASAPAYSNTIERDVLYYKVEGSVIASGTNTPLIGANVKLGDYETVTDSLGAYSFAAVAANTSYSLIIEKDSYIVHTETVDLAFDDLILPTITLIEITNAPTHVVAMYGRLDAAISWTAPDNSEPELMQMRGTRALLSYDIWRAAESDLEDEEAWVEIARGVTNTNYIDHDWRYVEPGNYAYIIKANYSANVSSELAYSNIIERDLIFTALNGRVFASGLGTPLAGATVTLEGPDSHTAITTATGSYSFTEVIANSNYTMKVEKDNYITHTETIQSTFVDKIMPIITLQEITNAPSNVLVNAGRLDAEITWTSPDNSEPDLMMRSRATRALLNYDIWRVTEDDIENEDAWIVIARAVVGNTYIDTNWRGVELGNYAYIIKAKYSGGIVSDYAVSNTVERDVIYNSISGFVLASGTEDGLAGATVTLTGIETYTTTTSATGEYLFAEVIANNNYTLKIEKDNYITHTEDIVTVYDDIEIEDLILQEITNAPINVMATTGRLDAAISWSAPNNSEPALLASRGTRALISYDIWRAADGSDEDDWVELATGLTVTEYTDSDWRFVEPGDYVYIVRANYSGGAVSEYAVSNTVERGIIYNSISGLVLASGTDEGLAGATIKLTGIATYTTTSSATGAYSFGHVIANNNYTLTIEKDHYIVHIETVDLAFDDLILPTITLEEITNAPTNVIASASRLDTAISWTAPNNSEPAFLASRGTRALISYDIWRAADGSDEDDWVELATGLTVTQYTDEDWRFVEPGDYIYIVRANYSGNVVSENAVSNIVERDVIYNSINGLVLASGTGDGLAGAIITLTGIETYTTTSSATGAYSFGQVIANNEYTLTIEKDNYITHTGEIAIAFADIVIPTITINEITNAPTDVIANAGRLNVAISWTAPNNSSPDLIRQNGSRALLSYDIWRAIAGDTDDWTVIATNLTTTSFTDTNWRYAEPGNYVYMVRANYSGGAVSENAVSNIVERDVIYNSISGFVLESGENIGLAGATITLTGIETYTTTSSATGAYSFEQVIANNNYTLTIAKDNYTTYSVEIMTVFADIVIPTITLEEITNAPTDVIANAGRLDTEITWTAPNNTDPTLLASRGTRALISYDIWRAIAGDTDNWTVIATNLTTTSFTDTNWRYAELGNYVYIVRANYSGGVVSENAVSNTVERDVIYNSISGFVLESGENIGLAGATITLTGVETYTTTSSATGAYSFEQVRANINYTLTIEKDNYITHTEEIVTAFADIVIPNITLEEITNAPTDVIANAGRLNVELSWTAPNNSSPDLIRQNRSRALLSYDIWRVLEGDTDDWTVIASNLTTTSFTDTSWRYADLGNYVYIVRANYSGGVVSENAVSNTVSRNVIYNSISGLVLASGTENPLPGATITLTGIETYTTTSSATGAYNFGQVRANNNYTLTIEKDHYITHIEEIVTAFTDIVIPNITLEEITNAPTNVIANAGRLDTVISWTAPDNSESALLASRGTRALISYDIWRAADGSDEDDWVELATGLPITEYTDSDWCFVEPGDYVYIVRANYSGGVVSENAVSNAVARDVIYNSISGYVLASGTDDGLAGATITLTGIETYTTASYATGAYSFGQVRANNNYTLTIEKDNYISHTEEIVTVFADIVIPTITLEEITNAPTDVIANAGRLNVELSWTAPNNSSSDLIRQNGSRALLSYDIWRALEGDTDDWTVVATNLTNTSFIDASWRHAELGNYVYMVRANYSGGVVSENAVSNTVERDVIYNSISGIVLASGENIGLAGATITLEGIEIYTTTSSATGAYSFEQVIANRNYTLTIEKDNYITHTGEIVTVFADIVIPTITLQEITNPPTDVVASANQNQVELAWEAPDNSRAMLDYIIWRAEQGSSSNEDTWLEIASAITTTSYTDESWANIEPGTYVYIVKARYSGDVLSEAAYSNIVEKEVSADINPIYATKLHKNYPNPFNPSTTISFSVIEATHVKIEIYNTAGQKVRTLVNDVRASGNHSIVWNGHDDSGKNVGSGVYFYRMTTPKFSATQKMLLMK